MQLDYLLSDCRSGAIHVTSGTDSAIIQEFLFTHGCHWIRKGTQFTKHSYLYIRYKVPRLTYGDKVPDASNYTDITQEVYQLAGLLPTPYEFW